MKIGIIKMTAAICAVGASIAISSSAYADTVYLNAPTNLAIPPNISWHNTNGPVIADDFIPIYSGTINHLTWWGSIATSNQFEIVLQNDNGGQPGLTPSGNIVSGGLKQIVDASSAVYDLANGIYQFDANMAPGFDIGGGIDYWLTIANVNNGWDWAEALAGPTVGSELYNAHKSTGPLCTDGGPHCGPWTDVHTDFAFEVSAVPEPATWMMLVLGFACVGGSMRRRTQLKVRFA